jgi:hypothetical protein
MRVCRRRAMLGRPGGAAGNPNVADALARPVLAYE